MIWLVLSAPLVVATVILLGSSASAQVYPPAPLPASPTSTTSSTTSTSTSTTSTTTPTSSTSSPSTTIKTGTVGQPQQVSTTSTLNAVVSANQQSKSASGSLAFTGAQIAGLVALGLALLAVGTAFVVRARRPRTSRR